MNIPTLDKGKILRKLGVLSDALLQKVNDSLMVTLGILA